jgi:hypothetical protein
MLITISISWSNWFTKLEGDCSFKYALSTNKVYIDSPSGYVKDKYKKNTNLFDSPYYYEGLTDIKLNCNVFSSKHYNLVFGFDTLTYIFHLKERFRFIPVKTDYILYIKNEIKIFDNLIYFLTVKHECDHFIFSLNFGEEKSFWITSVETDIIEYGVNYNPINNLHLTYILSCFVNNYGFYDRRYETIGENINGNDKPQALEWMNELNVNYEISKWLSLSMNTKLLNVTSIILNPSIKFSLSLNKSEFKPYINLAYKYDYIFDNTLEPKSNFILGVGFNF